MIFAQKKQMRGIQRTYTNVQLFLILIYLRKKKASFPLEKLRFAKKCQCFYAYLSEKIAWHNL